MGVILGILAFLIAGGQIVGWPFREFPDWDQVISIPLVIQHRSMITHSCLLVFLVAGIPRYGRKMAWGAAIGLAIHLVSDMFPKAWKGFAFIHIPLFGRLTWIPFDGDLIPTIFSFLWLGGNVLAGFYIAAKATQD